MFYAGFAAAFEQVERAVDVGADVKSWIGNRRPNASPGRKMEDLVEAVPGKKRVDQRRIADVSFDQRDALTDGGDIAMLDGWVVEVVEVIDHDDIVALRQEGFAEVRADEAGAAGD